MASSARLLPCKVAVGPRVQTCLIVVCAKHHSCHAEEINDSPSWSNIYVICYVELPIKQIYCWTNTLDSRIIAESFNFQAARPRARAPVQHEATQHIELARRKEPLYAREQAWQQRQNETLLHIGGEKRGQLLQSVLQVGTQRACPALLHLHTHKMPELSPICTPTMHQG